MNRLIRVAVAAVDKDKVLADATLAQIMDDCAYVHDGNQALLDLAERMLTDGVNEHDVAVMRQEAEAIRDTIGLVLQNIDDLKR